MPGRLPHPWRTDPGHRSRCGPVATLAFTTLLLSCSAPGSGRATPATTRPAVPQVCGGAPKGRTTTHHIQSAATGGTERYRVYETPGTTVDTPADLVILLHGAAADETQWLDVGITSSADCLAAGEGLDPLVIVLVDGSSVESARAEGVAPMEGLVVDEILPAVRRSRPHLAGRDGTSIGGISLGGGWALRIVAHRPDLFSAVGGHSPAATLTPDEARSLGDQRVRVWLDVGRADALDAKVADLQVALGRFDVDPMVMRWQGGHDRRYWSDHTEDYLRFYAHLW